MPREAEEAGLVRVHPLHIATYWGFGHFEVGTVCIDDFSPDLVLKTLVSQPASSHADTGQKAAENPGCPKQALPKSPVRVDIGKQIGRSREEIGQVKRHFRIKILQVSRTVSTGTRAAALSISWHGCFPTAAGEGAAI